MLQHRILQQTVTKQFPCLIQARLYNALQYATNNKLTTNNTSKSNHLTYRIIPSITNTNIRYFATTTSIEHIHVPQLGDDIKSVKLINISKKQGDHIEADDILATIETDKVACDIRVPTTGIVNKLYYNVNDTIKINDVIADIEIQNAAGAGEHEATKTRTSDGHKGGGYGSKPSGDAKEQTATATVEPTHSKSQQYMKQNQKVAAGPKADLFHVKQYHTTTRRYANTGTGTDKKSGAVQGNPKADENSESFYGTKPAPHHSQTQTKGSETGKHGGAADHVSDATKEQSKQKQQTNTNKDEDTQARKH